MGGKEEYPSEITGSTGGRGPLRGQLEGDS